jgi:hydroxymethylpyrimidine pyrophosphatase-like HAD family hydrolase
VLDLDGTTKMPGKPINPALPARLSELRRREVKVILATGRSIADLRMIIDLTLFDAVVAENGTIQLIGGRKRILVPREWFPIREAIVKAYGSGSEEVVVSLDRSLLPDAQSSVKEGATIELNKDRIMIMPTGFDKGKGVVATLRDMGVTKTVMCVGDGENDLSMFMVSDFKVALENSVDILKKEADYVASRPNGEGVVEAIDELILR